MPTVLLTWELGGNAGHVIPLRFIASELKKRGHKVLMAVKDVSIGQKHLSKSGIEFVQAPVWIGRIKSSAPPAINYAELLMRVGYLDSDQVAGQIRAWLHLMDLVKPDLVLADHSPSVLLAARVANIPAMGVGTGFFTPPVETPMPSIQPQISVPRDRFVTSEEKVLASINQALNQCGGKSLKTVAGLFASSNHYYLTLPEADHYIKRKNARYWGLIHSSKNEDNPTWPKGDGPKVYIYMQHHSTPFEPLLKDLKQLGWPTLIVSRSINQQEIESYAAANLIFSQKLVNLEAVAQQADIVITNCNHGTTLEMLQKGCKQLAIPLQIEQSLLAYRLASQGLLVACSPNLPSYRSLLEETSNNTRLESNVKKFSEIYGKMTPNKQLIALVDDIVTNFHE